MQKRTLLIGAILGGLLATAFGGPPALAGVISAFQEEQPTVSNDCVVFDESGNQKWFGEADMNVTALGTALQEVVDERPDQTTGVALCSHFEGATVFVSTINDEVNGAISEVASEYPDLTVTTHRVRASLATLIATGTKLLGNPATTNIAVGVGPDMYTGGLLVEVTSDRWPLSDADRQQVVEYVDAISSALPIRFEHGGESELSGVRTWNSGANVGG